MSMNGSAYNHNSHTRKNVQVAPGYRMMSTAQSSNHRKAIEDQTEVHSGCSSLAKPLRTQNELHKELLLAHKRGVALSHRSELQQVLERRKRVQCDQEEERQSKTPLDDMLLRRQQKQHEREKKDVEKEQEEAQLMEFVRVRQNLRKIHTVMHNKNGNF